jgi:hypothetical protein
MLSWIFIVLAHWNNSPRVDMSLHSDTLFWFRPNHSLIFLLNAACLAEKQQIPICVGKQTNCMGGVMVSMITSNSWPWSYGSWIYDYLCNQCLSPLMLWVRISIRTRCTTLCDKVCQWLAHNSWTSKVSEWLLFNANSAILWREQVNFQWDDDDTRFVPDQYAELDFYSASSLKQQSMFKSYGTLYGSNMCIWCSCSIF